MELEGFDHGIMREVSKHIRVFVIWPQFFQMCALCTTPHVTHILYVSGTEFSLLPVSALTGL